jgi:hypothetical protein
LVGVGRERNQYAKSGQGKKGLLFYVGFKFLLGLPFGFDFAKPSDL